MSRPGRDRGGWLPPSEWLGVPSDSPRTTVLALATVLALLLRLVFLGRHPLWIDEYLTWTFLRPDGGAGFAEQVMDVFQTPLTIAVLWPLSRGECSEWLLRLPSALAGSAAVPVGALVAARFGGRRTGEWAALLLALSPFLVWFSQDARGYAFQILLTAAATLQLLRMMREGPTIGGAALYGCLAGLGVLANNSTVFLVAAQGLSVVLLATPRDRGGWLRWAAAFGLAALVGLPWLLRAAGILEVGRLAPGAETGPALRHEPGFTPWAWPFTAHTLVYGFSLGPSLEQLRSPDRLQVVTSWLPLLAPAAAVAGFLVLGGLSRLPRRSAVAAVIWILVPLMAVSFLAMRNVKSYNPRYLAMILPVVTMLAAHGAARLRYGRLVGGALLVLVLVSLGGYHGADRYAREDLRAAARIVEQDARPGDVILAPLISGLLGHYHQGPGTIKSFWDCPKITSGEQAREALRTRIGDADRAWLVLNRSRNIDPGDRLPAALEELGTVVERREVPGVRLYAWRAGRAAPSETERPEENPRR